MEQLPKRLQLAMIWSIMTGCRIFETRQIIHKDVDLETRTARIIGKGNKVGTIDLNDAALKVLNELHVKTMKHDAHIFDGTNHWKSFKIAVKKAGLEHLDLTWHDLRHTYATWLRKKGIAIEVVQKALGHANIATTMRYAHIGRTEVTEANAQLAIDVTKTTDMSVGKEPRKLRKT